jgi:hypothetical protein
MRASAENTALYLSKDDGDYANTRNAVWVESPARSVHLLTWRGDKTILAITNSVGKRIPNPGYCDCKMVSIDGTFKVGRHGGAGHLNMFSSEIVKVSTIRERMRLVDDDLKTHSHK